MQGSESAEVALVERARRGDADAFAALVRQYQRRVVSVAYRLLGNIEDARDVSQEAFVRTFQALGQLEDPARFGAWLLRATTNTALNFRRARATRQAAPLEDATATDHASVPGSGRRLTVNAEADDGPLPAELKRAIDAAMDRLPEKQRLTLILFSVEGLPQKEVAEILECSVELVKWNVFQARKKLKELLGDYV